MNLSSSEISSILKEQIEKFDLDVKTEEIGKVLSVGDGIARVYGLEEVSAGEMVEFSDKTLGMALNLEEDNVGIVLFGSSSAVEEGQTVKRTKDIASISVGDGLLGRVIDPLGKPQDGKGAIAGKTIRVPLERKAPGVIYREPVTQPLQTGIKAIDALIAPMRERRAALDDRDDDLIDILREGSRRANAVAEETLAMAKEAAGLGFWKRSLSLD